MYIHVQVGGEEGRCGVEWVRILLHSHQPLLLELVRGGGGEGGGVRGEDVFLWPFLDLCLTSSGELDWERMTSSSWAKDERVSQKLSWWGQTSQRSLDSTVSSSLALISREYTHTCNLSGTPTSFIHTW